MKREKNSFSKNAPVDLIYGWHAVRAVLSSGRRPLYRLYVIDAATKENLAPPACLPTEVKDRDYFKKRLGLDAVHQGVLLEAGPLEAPLLDEVLANPETRLVMVLDQVTDPHNLGAILRSCAAFGASALIIPDRNSPDSRNPIIAKTASGAMENIPVVRVVNLNRALDDLKAAGFWCMGLDERGDKDLDQMDLKGRVALVMGAEGSGLRRLTRESCDLLVRLPTNPAFPTLNVSVASAISLYEWQRQNRGAVD
ncbi:MAG: 23S rRNA (guanosine(2251)-2'-O)-methyltransferase RlmB [Holosporales bacterium]